MKTNEEIATTFEEIANLLELDQANPYRVEAYRRAATVIRHWPEQLINLIRRGEPLTSLPGVGEDLAAKIREMILTGSSHYLDRIKRTIPSGLQELHRIPGLGPKRIVTLYRELGVHTLEELRQAAEQGKIRQLPGFGYAAESRILHTINQLRPTSTY